MENVQPSKSVVQQTTNHHKFTTKKPPKHHPKTPTFLKNPRKNAAAVKLWLEPKNS
jgi:hypothetical protein